MQLLVSVSDAAEARAALAGGADWIDAKDPAAGPLGMVTPSAFDAIAREVDGRAPVSAALGDPADVEAAAALGARFAEAGARLVKVGVGRCADAATLTAHVRACAAGVRSSGSEAGSGRDCRVVAVIYADLRSWALLPGRVIAALAGTGATGVLIDTSDKHGPGLRGCLDESTVRAWGAATRAAGLSLALAGRLTPADVTWLAGLDTGGAPVADVIGVRGAACEGGRLGRVTAARVSAVRACLQPVPAVAGSPR